MVHRISIQLEKETDIIQLENQVEVLYLNRSNISGLN